jgi:O-antigen/teichoic acid export membrane protein
MLRSDFLKNVVTLVSGTGFAQVIAIAIYPLLTRMYTPDDFGIFAIYMSVVSMTGILATGKYELSIMLPEKEEKARGLLALALRIALLTSIFLMILAIALNGPICKLLGNEAISPWLYLIPVSTLLVGSFNALKYHNNRAGRFRTITGANVGQSLTNSGIKLAAGPMAAGPAGLISGTVLGQLSGFMFFFFRSSVSIPAVLKGTVRSNLRSLAREYDLFPKFNMVQGVINSFSGALPIFLFTHHFSAEVAGLFSLGYAIIYRPMNLVITAFFQVLFQNLIEKHQKNQKILQDILKFLGRLAALVLVPFLLFLFFAPEIFRVVFGEEWTDAGRYTQWMIPWLFMVSLTMPLSFIPDIFRRQKTAMIIDTVKLVLRAGALATGIFFHDVFLALALFSGISALLILYSLLWYLRLVRRADMEKT